MLHKQPPPPPGNTSTLKIWVLLVKIQRLSTRLTSTRLFLRTVRKKYFSLLISKPSASCVFTDAWRACDTWLHTRNNRIILIFTFLKNFLPATTIRLYGEKLYFYDSLEGRNLRKKESNKQAVRRNNMGGKFSPAWMTTSRI